MFMKILAYLAFFIVSTSAQAESIIQRQSSRPDGSTIDWTLWHPEGSGRRGIIVLSQGSGCAPTSTNAMLHEARAIAPLFTMLTVEKYGVKLTDQPKQPMVDCSPTFFAHHTVTQRVLDIERVLRELEGEPWWNGQLVLFGGSEGGAVVARLMPRIRVDAAVIYSTGLGKPLAQTIKAVLPPFALSQADSQLAAARANPQSAQIWGGNSYRWWADIADSVLVQEVMKSTAPVLLIQGARDQSTPVSSARAARDAYAAARRCELTYWEYADYDHFMVDSKGESHRAEVFQRVNAWISEALSTSSSANAEGSGKSC